MKKYILVLLACCAVWTARAQQEVLDTARVTLQDQQAYIDSLENVVAVLKGVQSPTAQTEKCSKVWGRSKYFNIYYGKQDLEIKGEEPVKFDADIHAGFGVGKTFYLHKKPLANLIKFGLDWTYFQIDYSKYTYTEIYESSYPYPGGSYQPVYEEEKTDMHKGEVGMQFGPSITINPVNYLKVNAYFRYAPSASIFYDGDDVSVAYGSHFVSGFAVSYKVISLGMEGRWGESKFDSFIADSDDYPSYGPGYEEESSVKSKFKNSGLRFYLSFRF